MYGLQAMTSLCNDLRHVVSGRPEAEISHSVESTLTKIGLPTTAITVATSATAEDFAGGSVVMVVVMDSVVDLAASVVVAFSVDTQ